MYSRRVPMKTDVVFGEIAERISKSGVLPENFTPSEVKYPLDNDELVEKIVADGLSKPYAKLMSGEKKQGGDSVQDVEMKEAGEVKMDYSKLPLVRLLITVDKQNGVWKNSEELREIMFNAINANQYPIRVRHAFSVCVLFFVCVKRSGEMQEAWEISKLNSDFPSAVRQLSQGQRRVFPRCLRLS